MKEAPFFLAQAFTPGFQDTTDLFPARFSGLPESSFSTLVPPGLKPKEGRPLKRPVE